MSGGKVDLIRVLRRFSENNNGEIQLSPEGVSVVCHRHAEKFRASMRVTLPWREVEDGDLDTKLRAAVQALSESGRIWSERVNDEG